MSITLTQWQVLSIIGAIIAAGWAFGRVLIGILVKQFREQLDLRFAAAEAARERASERWQLLFDELRADVKVGCEERHRIETDLTALRIQVIEDYIKRQEAERLIERIVHRLDQMGERIAANHHALIATAAANGEDAE